MDEKTYFRKVKQLKTQQLWMFSATKTDARVGKKALEKEDANNREEEGKVQQALYKIDLRHHISAYTNMDTETYRQNLQLNMDEANASDFDSYDETRTIWNDIIEDNYKKHPIPLTKETPQCFEGTDNNINKFFGNVFGNQLHRFFNVMAIHYSGNSLNNHDNLIDINKSSFLSLKLVTVLIPYQITKSAFTGW